MARKLARLWIVILLLTTVFGAVDVARSEAALPPTRDEAVSLGRQLEQTRKWHDAIDFYEEVLEAWPDDENLSYGLRRSKFQFSIERRYTDESFRSNLLALPRAEALDVLEGVLNKIEANFVEPISAQSVVAHGTESLWLALANDKFRELHLSGVSRDRIRQMRTALRREYWNKPIAGRQDVRRTVGEVCDMGERLLGLDAGAVVMEYVFGACNCLDDYSSVLTPTRYADLFSNIDGEFVGIGIVMEGELGRGMALIDVLPESPAEEAGLLPGEWIIAVDRVDCRFLATEEAATMLTGPEGSRVRLEIEAEDGSTREVACRRREVKVKSIPVATMLDTQCGVAYIRLTAFQKTSTVELDEALNRLKRQGMRSLVWDLRGNPGGLLNEAVSVLDRFIDDGVLVSTRGRQSTQDETFRAFGPGTWRMPLVLLIDGNSASASEIVAGAIHDHQRGTIIGRRSYGKWSVQSIYPTTNGMGLRLTTAKFYSPNGDSFSKIGVKPDIVVPLPEGRDAVRRSSAPVDPETDPDLKAALEHLCGQSYTRR
ncbi:MAG: S41 family peptidase [Planctomycetota bacterium]|nr:MAG: S41 family peptidase [Planctomycetota bacterium]REJ92824.1 MAG: S41 family peptidase [Planctomycetota bacterium]REK24880.1 MAG: S41 family peptidase [Planctomycetota bacterium]REK40111.1 MAG: S41 family peptidase [Planctomycetota bacterium]